MDINNVYKVKARSIVKVWLILFTFLCSPSAASAIEPQDSTRVFTEEHPLVYEDAWDLWPYAFLNENGEAVGFNIDLLKLIFKRLNIPYIIKLKPTTDALNDLKSGHADLMLGMDAHFHNEYAQYGKSVIQLFTHSVVHHKDKPANIKTLKDLGKYKAIVHGGSFSHHLMIQNGWSTNAIPYNDMQEAIQKAHDTPDAEIVWNTLSLKWLIRKYKFNDLELSPVDIQHGEYKFMSNNPHLLQQLDSVYTILCSEDLLQPIQNKWFYPEKKETGIPSWVWKLAGLFILTSLGFMAYYAIYRLREKKVTKEVRRSNNRLGLILRTSKVRIWIYNIATRTITKFNEQGEMEESSFSVDFVHYTTPQDFERISDAIREMSKAKKEQITLNIRAKDHIDSELRELTVNLSVLRRDKYGQPTDIIGTASDITDERKRQIQVKDTMLRYQLIFNTAMVDIVAYDKNGIIIDMNEKATQAFAEGKQKVIQEKISINEVLGMDDITPENLSYTYLTQLYRLGDDPRILNKKLKRPQLDYELQLVPIRNDQGKLISIIGTGRNVTEVSQSYAQLRKNSQQLQEAHNQIQQYIKNINYVLKNGNIRIAYYSPQDHTMSINRETGHVQYTLTQARALALIDKESKRIAQRGLNSMDNYTTAPIDTTLKTTIRLKGDKQLYIQMAFIPTYDEKGQVKGYFGMCRDVSEIKATELELERETIKAQEIETVKNAFLHNMSYEIRTPLNTVVGFAELFEMEHNPEDEAVFIKEIKQSSTLLLKLINEILFLSRLDARMIEFKKKPIDFAAFFEPRCQSAWFHNQQPGVSYLIDNPYEHLVVEIDEQNLGIIIDQLAAKAAQQTTSGQVRARYDYTGDNLVIAFQDTGGGIPKEQLEHIFERFNAPGGKDTGLGMSICQELARQMGGKIHIKSEEGKSTIVWVSIPCKVSEIERK